tara:strand:- start:135 stop:2261 length:2127 start_codon:yes stop_codon:yes gene_type:complete
MTISTAAAPLSYAGNGSTTAFAVTWAYKAKSHVVATLRNSLGVETVQVITTNYTLTDAGTSGTLTMIVAPATGETLVITSEPPNTQETDIPLGGSFPASSVEDALDLASQVSQKVENLFNRSLRVPKTDTRSGSELEIPNETDRADKVLAFNASGDPIAGEQIGNWTGNWATSTAYILRDIIKDTSNNNVYINIVAHTSTGTQPISSNADVAKWALVVDAAASAADAVSTAADAVSTAADAVSTAADVVSTNADVVSTNADVVTAEDSNLEAGDWANQVEDSLTRTFSSGTPTNRAAGNYSGLHWAAKTSADATATAADLVLTDADTTATAADVVTTNADVVLTAADVLTAEDSNLEAGDWANRAEDSLTRTFSSGTPTNRAAGNYSGLHWGAKTAADAVSTAADLVLTNADVVTTNADVVTTNADVVLTAADVVSADAARVLSQTAQTASELALDNFDDRYLGAKGSAPTLDNDGDALITGALYFDTAIPAMRVRSATSTWISITATTAADSVTNVAAGNIVATNVQDALNELDVEKLALSGGNMTGAINEAVHSEAAHATTSDIWSGGNTCLLTGGVVTFTDIADAPQAGAVRFVVANDAHIITDNANLEVDGSANYTCAANDVLMFTAKTTSTFRVNVIAHGDTATGGGGGATGGGTDAVFQENELIVTTDYTLTTAKNASSVGPITINSGITVTVPSGARWVII